MRPRSLGAVLGIAVAACSDAPAVLGAAADPQVGAYCVAGVRASPGTVHFTGLASLLDCAEATGPITLTANVGVLVQPSMVSTVTGVGPHDVSTAVGHGFLERYDLVALSTTTLTDFEGSRLEAYASFVESTWEVRDAACGAVLGTGASFEPSGVFFQTVPAYHVALPDIDLFGLVPGCEDLMCPSLPGIEEEGDAGAPTGGPPDRQVPGFIPTTINPLFRGHGGRR